MRSILPFALSAFLVLPAHAADTWAVREGAEGKVQGTWTIEQTGGVITGSAVMVGADGKPLKYRVAGKTDGANYTLHRVAPGDGLDCNYIGTVAKGGMAQKTFDVAGSAVCRGKAGIWSARQLPRASKR